MTHFSDHALLTKRLRLRRWLASDRAPFAALNADPKVMRYFPTPLSRADSDAMIDRIEKHHDTHGFGLWAVELKQSRVFIGFVGLSIPHFKAHFTPTVEIGWRLAQSFWGQGYATEGAIATLKCGFDHLGLSEIVSFTATLNRPSIAVMQRLGMSHSPTDNFDHPALPKGHPLQEHVLYRLSQAV